MEDQINCQLKSHQEENQPLKFQDQSDFLEQSHNSDQKKETLNECLIHKEPQIYYCERDRDFLCFKCLQKDNSNCQLVKIEEFKKNQWKKYNDKLKEVDDNFRNEAEKQLLKNQQIIQKNQHLLLSRLDEFQKQILIESNEFLKLQIEKENQKNQKNQNEAQVKKRKYEENFRNQMIKYQDKNPLKLEDFQKLPEIDLQQIIQNLDPIQDLKQVDKEEIDQRIKKQFLKFLSEKYLIEQQQNEIPQQNSQEQDNLQQKIKELEIQNQELKHQFSQNIIHMFEKESNQLHCYNYESKTYYQITTQIQIPFYHRSIQYQNKFYLVGGEFSDKQNSYQSSNQVWQVECDGKYMEIQTLQQARSSFGIAVANGTIYVVGGTYKNANRKNKEREILDKVECLKIGQRDQWVFRANLPCKMRNLTLVSDQEEENIYSFGGANEQKCSVNTIYKYNIQSDIWQFYEKTLPQPLCDAAVILDPLVVFGGKNRQKN